MFNKARHIDTAFRHVKLFSCVLVLGCVAIVVYTLYTSSKVIAQSNQRIFVLVNNKALEAYASDRKDNIPVEARDHVKMLHQYFFSLDPDEKVIESNITKALYLSDGSAKQYYDNLKENSYYTNIISGNISQSIEADSIHLDINNYPYHFRYVGRQIIVRPSSIVIRNLITEGWLRNVARSDNNPHGFLAEKWKVLENKDVKTEAR